MAKAVRSSFPTAGVPSSLLDHSMWVSWKSKLRLDRFFSGVSPVFPTTNFIPPFLHTHLIHFVDFVSSVPVLVRQAWSVGRLTTHRPSIKGLHHISSLDPAPVWARGWGYLFIYLFTHLFSQQKVAQNQNTTIGNLSIEDMESRNIWE